MSCAIKISNSRDCSLIDVRMEGFDIGIDANDSDGLILNQVDFGNCSTGMRGRNVRGLSAQGCTHGGAYRSYHVPLALPIQNDISFAYALQYLNVCGYNPY